MARRAKRRAAFCYTWPKIVALYGSSVTSPPQTRFDMEFGAGVAEGMEDQIGLISDTNFDAPTF